MQASLPVKQYIKLLRKTNTIVVPLGKEHLLCVDFIMLAKNVTTTIGFFKVGLMRLCQTYQINSLESLQTYDK